VPEQKVAPRDLKMICEGRINVRGKGWNSLNVKQYQKNIK
jgi:hypothetical protein